MRGLTVRQRIEVKTDMSAGPDACWPWVGGKGNSGTASMQIGKQSRSVRRVLWELDHGSVPESYVVSDTCGDRGCVNPKHLRLRSFILEERIWELCDRSGGPNACWIWQARRTRTGYGCFYVKGKGKQVAHRWAWRVTHGPVPEGMFVCHHCDNPGCVNPKHLFLGTPKENVHDMIRKGRQSNGPVHAAKVLAVRKYKVTPEKKAEIQRRRLDGQTIDQIAKAMGLSQGTIVRYTKGMPRPSAPSPSPGPAKGE